MRKLSLDVGSKSCGIAISDSLNITAQGLENFIFEKNQFNQLENRIFTILKKYEIDVIVVGRPTLPSGDSSSTTHMIENFANKLKTKISQKIVFIDENMSTKNANKVMIDAGLTRKKRKKYKDKISAQIILQNYLSII